MADSIVVDVPAETAWAFVSDPRRMLALQPNTTVQLLHGEWGSPGSRYLSTTRAAGQVLDTTHEIIRVEPPRLLETRMTSQGTVAVSLLQVEAVREDACVVILQGSVEWGGSFLSLVARITTALFGRRTLAASLDQLKQAIEAGASGDSRDAQPHLSEEG